MKTTSMDRMQWN